mmetsp:Transcript_32049/g.50049  ORF Transcript_32049/g.50049 Transcript_32049/m.50049 type:complete len:454 (-) Transcript_32049:139-1500(-)
MDDNLNTKPTATMSQFELKARLGKGAVSGESRKHWADQKKNNMFVVFIFAVLGIVIGVIENEIRWKGLSELWDASGISRLLKIGILVTSIITFTFLYKYYEACINLKRLCGVYLPPGVSIHSLKGAGIFTDFLFDCFLMLPQPLPGMDFQVVIWNKGLGRDTVYSIDSILVCVMAIRFMLLPKFYGECISDLSSDAAIAFARFNKITIDGTFIVKYLIADSLSMVSVLFIIQVAIFAYAMMVFERPTDNHALAVYPNCVWLVIITMTTVGYGDVYPTTLLGRIVAVMASIVAVIMLAITINLVISKLTLSRAESKVLEVIDKIELTKDAKLKAAIVIQRWYKAYKDYFENIRNATSKSGYMMIADLRSQERKNLDLKETVMSNLPLLEAINSFDSANASAKQACLQMDVPELVGNLASKALKQEERVDRLVEQATEIHRLVEQIQASRGRRAQ